MPLKGLTSLYTRSSQLYFGVVFTFFVLYTFFTPSPALANYYKVESEGGRCYMSQYNDSGNRIGRVEMGNSFCNGPSSCAPIAKPPDCENTQAYVPGSGQATECDDGGKIRAQYVYGAGQSNPPTAIRIYATGCGANRTWSVQGPGRGLHLNIDYYDPSRPSDQPYTSIRPGSGFPNRQSQEYYKIKNGEQEVTIALNTLEGDMANYTTPKSFIIYPNCAGQGDSVDHGCFRSTSLPGEVFDPLPPTCSVRSTKVGSDYRIDVTAFDGESGVQRMGLSFTPSDVNLNPTGAEIIQVNNDFLLPTSQRNVTQSFTIPGNRVNAGQNYRVTAKVWDRRGSNNYSNGNDYTNNYVECITRLQCIMPTEQVAFLASCTPRVNSQGQQYSESIVQALNLNQSGFCQVDYVNITEVGTTSPDVGNFTYPNYWNRATGGAPVLDMPQSFLKRDTGAELIMQPNKRYWISYWDGDSGQLTAGRSFVTRAACSAPTTGPTITAAPICKVDPHVATDPGVSLRSLVWNPLTSAQDGDNFLGYQIEVYQDYFGPAQRVVVSNASPSVTSAAFGAWFWEEIQAGHSYHYRVRGESFGGYGPWSALSSRYLIRKPSAPDTFRVFAYSSGQGVSGNPYIITEWTYDDATAPLRFNQPSYAWRNQTRNLSLNFSSTQTTYQENLTYAQCNNTNYNYSLAAFNECGTGPTRSFSFTCPANRAPTCSPVQYSLNNGATWANYPAAGITREVSTQMALRRECVDPEGNSVRYDWATSVGCGTFNPASQTLGSPHFNGGLTEYRFPTNPNMSCNLTSTVRDNLGHVSPSATVIAKTYPIPNVGTHSITTLSSIQRSNTADQYATVSGTLRDTGTVMYNVNGFYNPTAQGSTLNNAGTARIDTTSTTLPGGRMNVCHPTYGSCAFQISGTSVFSNVGVGNVSNTSMSTGIIVRLNATHQPTIRDVMIDPTTTNGKYGMRVNFSAVAANGTTLTAVANGVAPIVNTPPTCTSAVFGPAPGSPYRTGNINLAIAGRDDWGLRGLNVNYRNTATGVVTSVVNNANQFSARAGSAALNISTTNMASGYYTFNMSMTDGDGSSVSCLASGNITGDEAGTTPTPPVILVDKQAPTCGAGGMSITPNAAGDLLGFTASGTDPTVNNSYSGLTRIHILAKRPNETAFSATPVLAFNIATSPRPQTYTHTFSNASSATAYNLAGLPSGIYTFRAVWTDRAGNVSATAASATTPCDATYEKRSRVSGKVNMFTGIDGADKRDYAREVNGTQFSVGTRTAISQPLVPAIWQGATPAECTATYPGTAGSSTCAAYFVSGAEYTSSSPPIVELSFPRLSSDAGIGKYRCNMTVFNTLTSPWTSEGTIANTDASANGTSCSGTTCTCRFTLSSGDMTVDPTRTYSASGIWPTHVEFDIFYNSDQIYGRVENEAGNPIGGNTVTVNRGAWSSVPAAVGSGTYVAPSPVPDNTLLYGRTTQTTNVTLNNADPTRLCIWAARNNFVNPASPTSPRADAQRTTATTTFANANVRTVAQSLALTGFNLGVSAQCTTPLDLSSGPISPKNQNQVNFLVLPKVQVTGRIYYLRNDNMCGEDWTDSDNWSTDAPLTVNMDFATATPPPPNGALGQFYNPTNPTSPTGAGTYQTGQTYTVYANSLPGSQWNNWQIQANLDVTSVGSASYVPCEATTTIDVSDAIPNYPTGVNAAVINRPFAVFMVESNDWWQTYNGGVHGFGGITDRIPVTDSVREDLCGHDIHTIVGRGTCGMYTAGTPTIRAPFRGYATGGLVTTRGALHEFAGRNGLDWRITASTNWRDAEMKGIRLPFTTPESTDVTAIEKVAALGTGEGWKPDPGNLTTTIGAAGNGRAYFSGDQTINTALTFGNNNYILVDGDLTLNANLLASGTGTDLRQSVFIIASGDVTIGGGVSEINAYIYTPGNITISSGTNGADDLGELPLKIYGGLYAGGNVDFRRDISNVNQNWGYPTTQIMFNPALILRSRQADFPSQLKETNVYWTQE